LCGIQSIASELRLEHELTFTLLCKLFSAVLYSSINILWEFNLIRSFLLNEKCEKLLLGEEIEKGEVFKSLSTS
jgi:DNA polymerase III alpha subunit (gram-positive type)